MYDIFVHIFVYIYICFTPNHTTVFTAYKISLWNKDIISSLISSLAFFSSEEMYFCPYCCFQLMLTCGRPEECILDVVWKRLSDNCPEQLLKSADDNKISIWAQCLVLPQSMTWSGTYWSYWIAHTWINKFCQLHSSMWLPCAHHIVTTPTDTNITATCQLHFCDTSEKKQQKSCMLFASTRKQIFVLPHHSKLHLILCVHWQGRLVLSWSQNYTVRHCPAEFSWIVHEENKSGFLFYSLPLVFPQVCECVWKISTVI